MAVKLLISGEAGSGKTSLTKTLNKAFVISHDGKKFGFKIPHTTITSFRDVDQLIETIVEKVHAYKEKFKEYPTTMVFDSVSKIFDTVLNNCNEKYTGFTIYSVLNKEIAKLNTFIEQDLVGQGIDVVLISHAIYDADTSKYSLVAKGDFAKRGGYYAEVDQSIFLETKNNKRIIHFRSTKFPARTLREDDPDTVNIEDFNLQQYIETLREGSNSVDEFEV